MAQARKFQTKSIVGRGVLCAVVLGMSFGVGGCDRIEKMRKTIDQRSSEAKETLDSSMNHRATPYDPLTVSDKVWSGNSALRMHRGVPLPARYEDARGVALVSSASMSLQDIANAVSAQTGIPIRLTALTAPTRGGASGGGFVPPGSAAAPGGTGSQEMPISYEGPLSGLLDRLCAYFGVSWRYDGSAVSISRYETKAFTIEAMPGVHEIDDKVEDEDSSSGGSSSSGSSSSSGGTSSQTSALKQKSKTTISLKYWDELAAVLNSMIAGYGTVVVSPTMGTVTVTTTPDVMTTVSDYIAKENKRLSRQIAISVKIYSVNLGRTEDFTMAFDGVLKRLGGMTYSSAGAPSLMSSSTLGQLNIAVLNSTTNARAHATSVFKALSSIGDTTQVSQFTVTTLNNRPVSRRVGMDQSYIQSVTKETTTSTSQTTEEYTPTVGTIRDGFSLQMTPRLLDDGRILLQYSMNLTDILDMEDVTVGTSVSLTLPTTNSRVFVQQSMLRSGQTLMIGGVDQETTKQNKQGVGSENNFLLGGGITGSSDRFMLFMTLSPVVMDLGLDEERN